MKKKKVPQYLRREYRWGYLFIAAPFLQFILFCLLPVVFSLFASFTNWNMLSSMKVVGLRNYRELFADPRFWQAMGNTFFYYIGIPVGIAIGLLFALLMQRDTRTNKFFRVIYYLPSVSSAIAIAILWSWLYNSEYGIVNLLLGKVGIDGPAWLTDPHYVKPAMIIMGVWAGLGPTIIMLIASLKNIAPVYYEAAQMDGAGKWKCFWHITLPMLKPMLFYLLVIGFISNMQTFGTIYTMLPGGGPEYSGASVVYYLWQKAFSNYQMGYACAVAWILAIITFVLTAVQFKLRKDEQL